MKITVITAAYNAVSTVEDCIRSVCGQSHRDIEHIVIDGGSKDGTVEKIRKYEKYLGGWLSEKDNGFYYALNKAICMATGDIVGILNADDVYANQQTLELVAENFERNGMDSCYGDLVYVDRYRAQRIIRYWRSGEYVTGNFKKGWMPPHPAFFVRREIYEKLGLFNTRFRIAADYELMLRFLEIHKISTVYIPRVLVKMRWGGASNRNLMNLLRKTYEDYMAWRINGIKGGFRAIILKNISKLSQFRAYRGVEHLSDNFTSFI